MVRSASPRSFQNPLIRIRGNPSESVTPMSGTASRGGVQAPIWRINGRMLCSALHPIAEIHNRVAKLPFAPRWSFPRHGLQNRPEPCMI